MKTVPGARARLALDALEQVGLVSIRLEEDAPLGASRGREWTCVFEEMGEGFVGAGRPSNTTAQHSPRPRRARRGDPAPTLEATCPETAGPLPRI